MIYFVKRKGYKDSCHNIEITDKTVSYEEYKAFYSYFNFYYKFYQIKEIHEICLEEFSDFSKFLSVDNLNEILRSRNVSQEKVFQTGNKLLLNYCTAIKMLDEKIENYLNHNQPNRLKDYINFRSNIYDDNFSYRFFMRLRNYVVHNKMPFTKMVRSLNENCNIFMERKNLLKWKGWNTVKKDLEMMDEDICIQPYLDDIGYLIYVIYLQGLYYMAPDVINSLKKIEEFVNKYNIEGFDFIECEKIEDIDKGEFVYHPVPWKYISDCIEELNKHPKINISQKKYK